MTCRGVTAKSVRECDVFILALNQKHCLEPVAAGSALLSLGHWMGCFGQAIRKREKQELAVDETYPKDLFFKMLCSHFPESSSAHKAVRV